MLKTVFILFLQTKLLVYKYLISSLAHCYKNLILEKIMHYTHTHTNTQVHLSP